MKTKIKKLTKAILKTLALYFLIITIPILTQNIKGSQVLISMISVVLFVIVTYFFYEVGE